MQGEGISLRDFDGNYFGASMQQPEGELLHAPYEQNNSMVLGRE